MIVRGLLGDLMTEYDTRQDNEIPRTGVGAMLARLELEYVYSGDITGQSHLGLALLLILLNIKPLT